MSGVRLTAAQCYWVLLHGATGPRTNLEEPRFSAGAVLLLLRDLQAASALAADEHGRLAPSRCAPERCGSHTLRKMIRARALDECGWIERLCLSPTTHELRDVLNELAQSTARAIGTEPVRQRGLLGIPSGRLSLGRNDPALPRAVGLSCTWLAEPDAGRASVLRMLDLAGATRPLARVGNAELLKRAFIAHRDTAEWHSCDPVVAAVQNAAFMNATLTGAL